MQIIFCILLLVNGDVVFHLFSKAVRFFFFFDQDQIFGSKFIFSW